MRIAKLECESIVHQRSWDSLAEEFHGSFFHCYAYGIYASRGSNQKPLYVKAYDEDGNCVGIAVGTVLTPRFWPFSWFCRTAVFGALPATREKSPALEQAILVGLERTLRRRGVFEIRVSSYDSPNSAGVLEPLSYELLNRFEFYVDLSGSIEDIWNRLNERRRVSIRRAQKRGVESKVETSDEAIRRFYGFQADSLQRRGIASAAVCRKHEEPIRFLLDTGRAKLLVSYRDGIPLNAGLFGVFGGKAYYLEGGSSRDGNNVRGPSHLFWTAIEMLRSEGHGTFNLGGVRISDGDGASEEGLYTFKRTFGASIIPQPSGLKTLSRFGVNLSAAVRFVRPVPGSG